MRALFLICVWAGAVLVAHPALAQDFVIRGATVHTATAQGTLKNTDVLVRGGVIAAIGAAAQGAAGVTVVEAQGKELTPGLFGGLTDLGLEEVSEESQTVDSTLNMKSPA